MSKILIRPFVKISNTSVWVAYMHTSCVYMCAEPQWSRLLLQFFSTPLEGKLVQGMRNKAQRVRLFTVRISWYLGINQVKKIHPLHPVGSTGITHVLVVIYGFKTSQLTGKCTPRLSTFFVPRLHLLYLANTRTQLVIWLHPCYSYQNAALVFSSGSSYCAALILQLTEC